MDGLGGLGTQPARGTPECRCKTLHEAGGGVTADARRYYRTVTLTTRLLRVRGAVTRGTIAKNSIFYIFRLKIPNLLDCPAWHDDHRYVISIG